MQVCERGVLEVRVEDERERWFLGEGRMCAGECDVAV